MPELEKTVATFLVGKTLIYIIKKTHLKKNNEKRLFK